MAVKSMTGLVHDIQTPLDWTPARLQAWFDKHGGVCTVSRHKSVEGNWAEVVAFARPIDAQVDCLLCLGSRR